MYHQIMLEEELLSPVHEQLISDSIFTRRSPCKKMTYFFKIAWFWRRAQGDGMDDT